MPSMKKSKRLPTTKGVSRSENMRRITSKNTTPELIVRRLLFRHGFRYRLHRADLPGNPDIVFVSQCKVIFVHGCFWHAHSCRVAHRPRTNQGYWSLKLQRNQERDARHLVALKTARLGCADNLGMRAKGHCLCYAKADSVLEPRRESTAADTSEGQQSLNRSPFRSQTHATACT